jgi:hypothetical protein
VVTLSNAPDVAESDVDGGAIERQVRRDVVDMGALTGIRRSIAEICYALARELDSGELSAPGPVARELATRLAELERSSGGRVSRVDELAKRREAHVASAAPPDRAAGGP